MDRWNITNTKQVITARKISDATKTIEDKDLNSVVKQVCASPISEIFRQNYCRDNPNDYSYVDLSSIDY